MEKSIKASSVGLTVLGAVARVVPHPWNLAPVGGMSLFAGARLPGWQAYLLPIVLMAITNPFVGGDSKATPFVYLSFLINVRIGRAADVVPRTLCTLRRRGAVQLRSFLDLQFCCVVGFGFPHTLAGLANCYTLAIRSLGRWLATC